MVPTLLRTAPTLDLAGTDADGACHAGASELARDAMAWTVSPHTGNTTDWRAGCGRSARPVRREGATKPIGAPYPYVRSQARSIQGGANPLQVNLLRPVADRNCVAAR